MTHNSYSRDESRRNWDWHQQMRMDGSGRSEVSVKMEGKEEEKISERMEDGPQSLSKEP